MFVTPAFAQAAGAPPAGAGGGMDLLIQFAPIILLVLIFWLLIFRPQQKRMKAHQAMLSSISARRHRGDHAAAWWARSPRPSTAKTSRSRSPRARASRSRAAASPTCAPSRPR